MSTDIFVAAKIGDTEWLVQSISSPSHASRYDKTGYSAIHWAALHGRINCLKILVEKYQVSVNLPTLNGWYALHLCINKENRDKSFQCVKYLVSCGADVTALTKEESISVLHQAASAGLLDTLNFLLDHNAPLYVCNSDGHTAYDTAKLWGNRQCARFILDAIWKQDKINEGNEEKKLRLLRKRVCELQKTAVHQLQNERDFFSDITFSNWMEDKGYFDYPITSMNMGSGYDGLYKRLDANGTIDDCAKKMDRLSKQFSVAKKRQKDKRASIYPVKAKLEGHHYRSFSKGRNEFPGHAGKEPLISDKLPSRKMWNYSTNLNTHPSTNIKQPVSQSLGIDPDEEQYKLLPLDANLPVRVEKTSIGLPTVKLMLPGGEVQSNAVEIPRLPPSTVWKALSRGDQDRFQAAYCSKPAHIADVHHKRKAKQPPFEEIGHHLAVILDKPVRGNCSTSSELLSSN